MTNFTPLFPYTINKIVCINKKGIDIGKTTL